VAMSAVSGQPFGASILLAPPDGWGATAAVRGPLSRILQEDRVVSRPSMEGHDYRIGVSRHEA
jgi:hypothetical protein